MSVPGKPADADSPRPTANVYVDGFNLYYGCVRDTSCKWLDLGKLCRFLLSDYTIHRIRYFTARLRSRPDDPGKPQRQDVYLRALRTIPNLSIHEGFYLETTPRARLANPGPGQPRTVEVLKTEEKGSDVNLATYLLLDAVDQDADVFVVVSNDSDLVTPIEVVRTRFDRAVGLLNPYQRASRRLLEVVAFNRHIRQAALKACQFPLEFQDAYGTIRKPSAW
ncbi:MAG: NYN domain-containing protein [Chloroflexi bacterium]|nr:NYN domain-containing protein [Chloroflexota bacterium]